VIALIALLVAAAATPAISPAPVGSAAPLVSPAAKADEESLDVIGGFDIRSGSIDYNYSTGDYTIPTRFTATNGGTDISADRAKGNSKRKIITADGNVVIHQARTPIKPGAAPSHFTQAPSTLTGDHIDADGIAKIYTVIGHVRFTQGERDATADRGTFNDVTNEVHMEGHVVIKDQGQTLDAETVDYNTQTGDGKASGNVTVVAPVATPEPASAPRKKKGHG
jgi:lipopolysaccharide assembly outer membrane protein LptD (OstA)